VSYAFEWDEETAFMMPPGNIGIALLASSDDLYGNGFSLFLVYTENLI
jgi:hypothetical protein